ncbi:hypothetical protein ABTZ03_36090 [Kitasatospora sp. NPDC096077]|uniref:GP88 family protein n=1 Tax=Kitasatospora sp. NPDC096077 TaxID=3155544 RepID=UPI00332E14A6
MSRAPGLSQVDLNRDRHADLFPDLESLEAAGYLDQSASGLIAAQPDVRVDMAANRMPVLLRRQGNASFGELQQTRAARLLEKNRRWSAVAAKRVPHAS